MNTVPGFSQTLPAKHDWLTGKPVAGGLAHLVGISSLNEDAVARELATLGGVYKGLPYEFNDVKLTEAQHSRYSELMGTIKIDGKTLHQTLNSMIHSKEYDLDRHGPLEDGDRAKHLNKAITAYRKVAGQALLREQPDFRDAAVADDRVKKKKPQLPVKLPAPSRQSRLSGQPQSSGVTVRQQHGADALTALIQ